MYFQAYHQFAGTDEQRTKDLQRMIDDPEIKAVFMARGGYGSTRIIDHLNFSSLIEHPKWICGFSDITTFHLHLFNLGIATLHSPMPSTLYYSNKPSLERLKALLFGESENLVSPPHTLNKTGNASGRLVGGNLALVCSCIGTKSELNPDGNILFLEDVGEQLYNIDRMMVQIKRSGILENLSGFIAGQFSELEDGDESFGFSAYEIIHSHIKDFNYPFAFDFPIGHTEKNHAIPIGVEAKLKVNNEGVTLLLD